MQFLPSLFSTIQGQGAGAGKSSAKHAYSGLQNLQSGKSTQSFKSIMDASEIRANSLERAKEAREQASNANLFWQSAKNTKMLDGNVNTENASKLLKKNENHTSSQKSVAEAFDKHLTSGVDGKKKNENKEENSLIPNFISPYTVHDTANITREVTRLKSSEVDGIVNDMKAAGYDNKKVLTALENAGKSPLGITGEELAKVGIDALAGERTKITASQENRLLSIAQKINDLDVSDENLLANMKSSNPTKLLDGIATAIDMKGSINFSKDELKALTSTLQLSSTEEKRIEKLLGNAKDVTLDKDTFNAMFTPARDEITEKTEAMLELGGLLVDALPKAENNAKARENFEAGIEAKSEKLVDNSKILLETELLKGGLETLKASIDSAKPTQEIDTVQNAENPRANQNPNANASASANTNLAQMKQSMGSAELNSPRNNITEMKYSEEVKDTQNKQENAENAKQANTKQNTQVVQSSQFSMLTKTNLEEGQTKAKTTAQWSMGESLKNAVEVARNDEIYQNNASQEKRDTALQSQAMMSAESFEIENNSIETANEIYADELEAEKVFIQTEEAIASAVKNKVTKLEVKLNPVELGAMNVIITSRNGELTALIQPEKIETMQMIDRQIDALKRELEGQGVKLSNIEVELKSSDDSETQFASNSNDGQFHNPEGSQSQYNQEQMQSQLNDLARLRLLGRGVETGAIDINSLSDEEREMVQNLQDSTMTESINDNLNDSVFDIVA